MKLKQKIELLEEKGFGWDIIAEILDKNYSYIREAAEGGDNYESDE